METTGNQTSRSQEERRWTKGRHWILHFTVPVLKACIYILNSPVWEIQAYRYRYFFSSHHHGSSYSPLFWDKTCDCNLLWSCQWHLILYIKWWSGKSQVQGSWQESPSLFLQHLRQNTLSILLWLFTVPPAQTSVLSHVYMWVPISPTWIGEEQDG